jgi:hypothetical protein
VKVRFNSHRHLPAAQYGERSLYQTYNNGAASRDGAEHADAQETSI